MQKTKNGKKETPNKCVLRCVPPRPPPRRYSSLTRISGTVRPHMITSRLGPAGGNCRCPADEATKAVLSLFPWRPRGSGKNGEGGGKCIPPPVASVPSLLLSRGRPSHACPACGNGDLRVRGGKEGSGQVGVEAHSRVACLQQSDLLTPRVSCRGEGAFCSHRSDCFPAAYNRGSALFCQRGYSFFFSFFPVLRVSTARAKWGRGVRPIICVWLDKLTGKRSATTLFF